MPAKLEEITATYLSERHRFENADGDVVIASAWCNSDVNAEVTIKGQADLDELRRDQTYRFYGRWTSYKNRRTGQDERQFHFQSFVIQQPHSKAGVIQYLRAAGEGHNFGIARAARCFELFGSDAVKMLREQPAVVAERLSASGRHYGVTIEQAEKIAAVLESEAALEGCTLDLMDLLTGRGFPKSTARLATRAWGNRAAQIIRRNPYRLMRFSGASFRKCDSLYLDLGLPPAAIKRQALCIWYVLNRETNGNTFHPVSVAIRGLRDHIAGADVNPEKAIALALRAGLVRVVFTSSLNGPITELSEHRWISEASKADSEFELSQLITEAIYENV